MVISTYNIQWNKVSILNEDGEHTAIGLENLRHLSHLLGASYNSYDSKLILQYHSIFLEDNLINFGLKNKAPQVSFGPETRVFFKDSNIILKYIILGDGFGLKKHVCRLVGEY